MKRIQHDLHPIQEKRIGNALAVGRTLFESGYTYAAVPRSTSQFVVTSPKGRSYSVDMDTRSCNCEAGRYNLCKHVAALLHVETRIMRQVAQHSAMAERVLVNLADED